MLEMLPPHITPSHYFRYLDLLILSRSRQRLKKGGTKMTIDKAIEHLTNLQGAYSSTGAQHQANAIQLGIEALKLTLKFRAMGLRLARLPLPAETKD